jgi:hypothetical protein
MDSRQLDNFFTSRGAYLNCPACGYDGDWARIEGDADLKLNTLNGNGMIGVTAVLCQHCGYIRLHSLDAIKGILADTNET